MSDIPIIRPRYEEGQRVDFVPLPGNEHGPGGAGGIKLPEHHVISAHQKAIEEGQGLRKRAVIDRVIDDETIRLMLDDTLELVWAKPDEIQPLDSVSQLGDLVGPASRSLQDALEAETTKAEAGAPEPQFAAGDRVRGPLGREWTVTYRTCNEQWNYDLETDDGLRQYGVDETELSPA